MVKVCIIGCGMIAERAHIPAYRHLPGVFRISGVCDDSAEKAKRLALEYGIDNYYTDATQMLEKEKPDLVSVCVPNAAHKQSCMLALSFGSHVWCEKPLVYTYADAVELYDYAKRQGKLLMACQSMRFTPDRLAAKKFADSGGLGEVYYAQFARIRRRGIPTWGRFHIREHSGGGALIDIGVHMIDAIVWLMGNPEIESVSASVSKRLAFEFSSYKESGALAGEVSAARPFDPDEMDVEDFAAGSVRFKGGKILNFTTAWAANAPDETSIRLLGDKAGIDLPQGIVYSGIDKNTMLEITPNRYPDQSFFGHFYLVDNLADVLSGKKDESNLVVKPEETMKVAAILEMAYRSSEENREIRWEELLATTRPIAQCDRS